MTKGEGKTLVNDTQMMTRANRNDVITPTPYKINSFCTYNINFNVFFIL